MELDCYQHYFFEDFDTEEDFYKSTAPSEGIWKKFELLPTPPMSPIRTLQSSDGLSWLSRVLGPDDEWEGQGLFRNLSSIIIQDCMWSSFSASKQLEKAVHGRQSVPPRPPGAPPGPQILARPSNAHCVSPSAHLPTSDCVDPAAVLTYPASSCRRTASSGSESRTDSSDDEEEIDVVTVESKHNQVRLASVRKPVTLTVRADPCPKRFHASVHRQQHNYAARSPDSEPDDDDDNEDEEEDDEEELQSKRTGPASSRPASPSGSSLNSDTEDTDRRKNHNFLERKRRNDLRYRFLALRDQIPGLESAKTPKVAILTHATEYLTELHAKEKRHLQERKRLKARQQLLLRRLSVLKRS
ncbi:protein L-Myc-1b-like [Phycodurus eques]|uniref:protein L-Myc-1b-like n=1 Tax=Phycodurus eques TaxID=693459 RepID=UPI002ACEB6C9|nr:protein L-Myc-1b-like [Phycodurus eques]